MSKVDPLSVQVSLRVKVPKGTNVTKKALNQIYLSWVETGFLPNSVEIRGIFWQNPDRHTPLDDWRFSSGSDLSVIVKPMKFLEDGKEVLKTYSHMTAAQKRIARKKYKIEGKPRGDHEEARLTLQGALRLFQPF